MNLRSLFPLALAALPAILYAQPDPSTVPPRDSPEMSWWRDAHLTRDQRLAWWRDARFGMFIHWGAYSPLGNIYTPPAPGGVVASATTSPTPRKGGTYAEHIQRVLKIPIPEYRQNVVARFNPEAFDADRWVRLAKDAGMGYLVITAKHHDGFALYPSAVSTYDLPDATPFKRDPMRELKEACDRHGLKFGFYYSHAFDWGDENAPGNDWDYQNPGGDRNLHGGRNWWENPDGANFLPKARHYVDTKSIPQIQELIANYHPDILWFDTPHKLPPYENYRILKAVRTASPDVVVNGRLLRGFGDYDSTADRPAEFPPHPGDWEGIPTTNESYAYSSTDTSHKPPAHFIQLLAKAAARGGNLLMNIGPRGDGTFDPPDVQILQSIAQWMNSNKDSIQGTTRTPLPVHAWGESTRKGNLLFLHVFHYPRDGTLEVGGLQSDPARCYLLADPSRTPLASSRTSPLDLTLTLPSTITPDPADTVIVLEFPSPDIQTDPRRLLSPTQSNTLRAFDGILHGPGLRFGPGKRADAHVLGWTSPEHAVSWPVRLNESTTFDVTLEYDADPSSPGHQVTLELGQERSIRVGLTSGKERQVTVKGAKIAPGNHDFRVFSPQFSGPELFKLRNLVLTPIAQ